MRTFFRLCRRGLCPLQDPVSRVSPSLFQPRPGPRGTRPESCPPSPWRSLQATSLPSLGLLASFLIPQPDRPYRTSCSTTQAGRFWNSWGEKNEKKPHKGRGFPRPGSPTPLACLLPGEGSRNLLFSQPGGLPVPTLPHEWGTSPPSTQANNLASKLT